MAEVQQLEGRAIHLRCSSAEHPHCCWNDSHLHFKLMALPSWFRVCASLLWALALFFSTAAHAAEADVRRIWQMLDYLAVDYGGAVKNGAVASASEFEEMREFAKTSQTKIAALEPHPERAALVAEAQMLSAAIEAKKSSEEVAASAKSLANHLLAVYPVPSAPAAPPLVGTAAATYQAQCASCHGATGNGDGPAGLKLDPRPVAFTDKDRARERSAFALYQAISQGIEGTAMPGFATILEPDRWALAFFIGQFAHANGEAVAGQKVWAENAAVRAQLTSLSALSRMTQADLAKQVGDEPASLAMAYLHAHPEAVVQKRVLSFDVARQKLAQSLAAVEKGQPGQATELALSAYLDGVEPIEPTLATRDSALMGRIETAMGRYRALLTSNAAMPELLAQVDVIHGLFKEADELLGSSADATAAYLGSLTILVREGLEALLVVVAMIAFLRKAERNDLLRYVHAGWVGAMVLGGLASGVAILGIVALALLRFSARLPIGKFFSWSSALVAVLAVVLTGKGIAGLQEAGWLGASSFDGPRIDLLGLHPSLQGVIAQLLMAALVVAGFLWNARAAREAGAKPV